MGRIREVDRSKYSDYLKRAEECLDIARIAYENSKWNACAVNAIIGAIAAADALCVFEKGIRSASERHEDALALFLDINREDEGIRNNAKRLTRLLSMKTDASYGERLLTKREAEEIKTQAERFFEFVKDRINKKLS